MSKTERQAEVETLTTAISAAPNVYVTDFAGLNVARMTEFRRRLRGAGAAGAASASSGTGRMRRAGSGRAGGAGARSRCIPGCCSSAGGRMRLP